METRGVQVDRALRGLFPPGASDPENGSVPLLERAMAYSLLAGGKRLRPLLCLAACETLGGDPERALLPACGLELLHTYSLVHDDLPAMDDDDLRRGRPTSHRVFGEAIAILAGDALQTLAFELLAIHPEGDANAVARARALRIVAEAAGRHGMAEGQLRDLAAEHREVTFEEVLEMDRRKTAALLRASVQVGGVHAGAGEEALAVLGRYGESLGLCFQLVDDLLDLTGVEEKAGKALRKDAKRGKATAGTAFGVERGREAADRFLAEALSTLDGLGSPAPLLRALAGRVRDRDH